MLVTDLHHFLDLPEDTPGPAARLAKHLNNIVRAATAGDAGTAWESALPCPRRPAHHRCPGRMVVLLTEPGAPIRWQCSVCDDAGVISNWQDSPYDLHCHHRCPGRMVVLLTEPAAPIRWQCSVCDGAGVISNWQDSPFDLRRRHLTLAETAKQIVISNEVAAALRDLRLLDPDCERLVFRIRAHNDHAILAATDEDLDELIGYVAAEANHEPNRRRQQRLDNAFDALTSAAPDRW